MHGDGNGLSLGEPGAASLAGAGSLRPPQPGHGASFALTSQHTESGWWAKTKVGTWAVHSKTIQHQTARVKKSSATN